MLNNSIGIFLYLVLRNDYSWRLLSKKEKRVIFHANYSHNNIREDYHNPALYNQGKSFDSGENRMTYSRGKLIHHYLKRYKPKNVLEIGPGSGFFTKQIVEYPSVKKYIAYDINKNFLKFIYEKLSNFQKEDFTFEIIDGILDPLSIQEIDSIILISTVHHIPDRFNFFDKISEILSLKGTILAIDPTHYILRLIKLLKECLYGDYLKKKYRQNINNLSTHHFCTLGEYKRICKKLRVLNLAFLDFFSIPKRIPKFLYNSKNKKSSIIGINRKGGIIGRFFSAEMAIIFEKIINSRVIC